jgi:hypothetical protein
MRTAFALTLEANEIGTGGKNVTYWQTDWGSYDRDYNVGKRLRVLVRDISRKVSAVDVDVYFVGRLQPDNTRFIYAHHHEAVELHGLLEVEGSVIAPDLKLSVLNLAALGQRYQSGAEIDGWIVLGTYRGTRFGVRAANQTLLDIVEANGRQTESMEELIADYDRRQPHSKSRPLPKRMPPAAPRPTVNALRPQAAQSATPPAFPSATIPVMPAPPAEYVTLTRDVEIRPKKTVIPKGSKLLVVSRGSGVVGVRFEDRLEIIPQSAVAESK